MGGISRTQDHQDRDERPVERQSRHEKETSSGSGDTTEPRARSRKRRLHSGPEPLKSERAKRKANTDVKQAARASKHRKQVVGIRSGGVCDNET